MSDRVAVMMGGEIVQVGTPEEIYTDPQDIRVAGFIGSPRINTLAAEVGHDGAVMIGATRTGLVTSVRGPVTFAIRPRGSPDCRWWPTGSRGSGRVPW